MASVAIEEPTGRRVAVEVSPEVAAVLSETDPPLRAVTFTDLFENRDLAKEPWLTTELRLYYRGQLARIDVSPWEGPRISFAILLGVGRIWHGDPYRGDECRICHGAPLPREAACLGCCRTGRELDIPSPTGETVALCAQEERKRQQAERKRAGQARRKRRTLKGGVGA